MSQEDKPVSKEIDDEQLMLEYAGGNMQAFELLYSRHEQSVYRYAYNGCSNEATARELFQEVWLRVIKARETFKHSQPFKPWLFSIARNLLTDHYRRQSSNTVEQHTNDELSADQDTWAKTGLTPEQISDATQQRETLHGALQRLPQVQREAFMLKHIAGFTISEVAQLQGQGTQAVKSRLRYAMVKLRQHLKELS